MVWGIGGIKRADLSRMFGPNGVEKSFSLVDLFGKITIQIYSDLWRIRDIVYTRIK